VLKGVLLLGGFVTRSLFLGVVFRCFVVGVLLWVLVFGFLFLGSCFWVLVVGCFVVGIISGTFCSWILVFRLLSLAQSAVTIPACTIYGL
jgi:hypothetical protein